MFPTQSGTGICCYARGYSYAENVINIIRQGQTRGRDHLTASMVSKLSVASVFSSTHSRSLSSLPCEDAAAERMSREEVFCSRGEISVESHHVCSVA